MPPRGSAPTGNNQTIAKSRHAHTHTTYKHANIPVFYVSFALRARPRMFYCARVPRGAPRNACARFAPQEHGPFHHACISFTHCLTHTQTHADVTPAHSAPTPGGIKWQSTAESCTVPHEFTFELGHTRAATHTRRQPIGGEHNFSGHQHQQFFCLFVLCRRKLLARVLSDSCSVCFSRSVGQL